MFSSKSDIGNGEKCVITVKVRYNSTLSNLKYFLECLKQFGTWRDWDDTSGISGMAGYL